MSTDAESKKEQENEGQLGRRRFFSRLFRVISGLWALGFFGVVVSFIRAPGGIRSFEEKVMRVGPLSELDVGSARFVAHERDPFWVIRTGPDQITALPATCTHLRCILQWEKESGRLVCPCHAGAFDLNGNVVAGPPPRPLRSLRVETRGGIVYVNLS
jgi:cytochrome b6-f complex iron-sulfur subunit